MGVGPGAAVGFCRQTDDCSRPGWVSRGGLRIGQRFALHIIDTMMRGKRQIGKPVELVGRRLWFIGRIDVFFRPREKRRGARWRGEFPRPPSEYEGWAT